MASMLKLVPCLLLIVAFQIMAQKDKEKEEVKETFGERFHYYEIECYQKYNTTNPRLMHKAVEDKKTEIKEAKCFFGCLFIKFEVINNKTEVVDDKLAYFMSNIRNAAQVKEVHEECADLEKQYKGADECEMGYQLRLCIYEADLD